MVSRAVRLIRYRKKVRGLLAFRRMPRQDDQNGNQKETIRPPKDTGNLTVAELVEEAAICMAYGSGGGNSQGPGTGGISKGGGH